MSDYEKAKAAFDYIITHVSMGEPIGLDLWRIHGGWDAPIPLVEQKEILLNLPVLLSGQQTGIHEVLPPAVGTG